MYRALLVSVLVCLLNVASGRTVKSQKQDGDIVKLIIVGDWGDTVLGQQESVANGMSIWADNNQPDFILTVGDNFYPAGLRSATDVQLDNKWRYMYNQTSLVDLTWYISVGNHDYGGFDSGREWFQVEFGKTEPRWHLPHLWYDFVEVRDGFTAQFIIIDSEAFHHSIDRNNYTMMLIWFEQVLVESTADWKFVVGHRNVFSAGQFGPVQASLYNVFLPIMERHNVDAYICGHDHNLEHLKRDSGEGLDFIISGTGGSPTFALQEENVVTLKDTYQIDLLFFESVFGFTTLTLSDSEAVFDFFNHDAELLYSHTRVKS